MRKVSKILFLVGGIMSFVFIGIFVLLGLGFIILGAIGHEYIVQMIQDGTITVTSDIPDATPEMLASIVVATFIATGVMLVLFAIPAIFSGIFAFKAKNEDMPSTKLLILNIIFGAISGAEVNMVGAILGLIANKRERNRQEIIVE